LDEASGLVHDDAGYRTLTLYTGAEGCKGVGTPAGDVTLAVSQKDGKPSHVGVWGALVRRLPDEKVDENRVKLTLPATLPGEADIAMDLSVDGYPVKVAGKVRAAANCAP
jgi:hypothetical protein